MISHTVCLNTYKELSYSFVCVMADEIDNRINRDNPVPEETTPKWVPVEETEMGVRITQFLSTLRSENTRTVAREIVNFLFDIRYEWNEGVKRDGEWLCGWTRSSEIFKKVNTPNPFTVTRLLRDLVEAEILERRECPKRGAGKAGKKPVFYRVTDYYQPYYFSSREDLLAEINRISADYRRVWMKYSTACDVYNRKVHGKQLYTKADQERLVKHGEDLDTLVKKRQSELEIENAPFLEEIKKERVSEIDPCDTV